MKFGNQTPVGIIQPSSKQEQQSTSKKYNKKLSKMVRLTWFIMKSNSIKELKSECKDITEEEIQENFSGRETPTKKRKLDSPSKSPKKQKVEKITLPEFDTVESNPFSDDVDESDDSSEYDDTCPSKQKNNSKKQSEEPIVTVHCSKKNSHEKHNGLCYCGVHNAYVFD
jgi:hypothetical protein